MPPIPPPDPRWTTLRWEALRAALLRPSFVAAQGGGLLLLIGRDHFHAPPLARAAIASAHFAGLILSPLAVRLSAMSGLTASGALGLGSIVAGAALALAASGAGLPVYLLGVLVGIPLASACAPLVTALWQAGVPAAGRGRSYARVTSLAGLAGVLAAAAWGAYLGTTVSGYRPVLLAIAVGLVLSGLAARRIPSRAIAGRAGHPFRVLGLLFSVPRFGLINLGWFLLGFGNLATMPLRTEYLRGAGGVDFGYSAEMVLGLVTVLPQAVALGAALVWGRLFDRFGFFGLRVSLNACFVASLLFFFTPHLAGQVLGAVLLGLGLGGEQLVWGLWVTDFAPAEETADYMAVHTFLTGLRGIAGPFAAYLLLRRLPIVTVSRLGLGLIVASLLLFAWIARHGRVSRPPGASEG